MRHNFREETGMKFLFMVILALVVLGGGGAGAYYYFAQQAEASAGDGHAKVVAQAKEEVDTSSFEFVELDPLILPIVDATGVSQTVSMVIAFEVIDSSAAGKVEHMAPKLKDAFIQDMYGMFSRQAALEGGVIKVGVIKKRLNYISDKVMGDESLIHDVLLQVVQQRPI